MKEINDLLEKLKDTKISYSVGFYAIALMVKKNLISVDEVVKFIEDSEEQIDDKYKTELKSEKQLEEIKCLFKKSVTNIECVFVDNIKEYVLGVVFNDDTYVTLKSYEDLEKIKNEIEKIK